MKRLRATLPLLLLVFAGLALFGSGALDRLHPEQLLAHQAQLRRELAESPWLSRMAYIGLLTLAMATGIPGTIVIILAGGFAFGVLEGTLCSSIGVTLGSLILYLASRRALGSGQRQAPKFVARLRDGFERHPLGYTMFLRFVPIAPFGVVTVGLAWLRCPTWLFLCSTWLGGTVSLIFESSIGAGIGDALKRSGHLGPDLLLQRQILLPLGAIALLVTLPLWIKRRLANRPRQPFE